MWVLLKVYFVLSHVHKASFLGNKLSFLNFSTIKEVSYSIEMTICYFLAKGFCRLGDKDQDEDEDEYEGEESTWKSKSFLKNNSLLKKQFRKI